MQKSFRRQFIELASGSTLAQIFSFLLMPIVSRIYAPDEMGDYGLYVAISSIAGLLSTLRLDLAIILADENEEASGLLWLAISLSILAGIVVFPSLIFLKFEISFSAMTALSTIGIGSIQALVNWHSRRRSYGLLASRNASEKLIVLLLGIALGWHGYSHFGLIAAQTVGSVFSAGYLVLVGGLLPPNFGVGIWRKLVSKFSDFPRKNLFSTALLTGSIFLPSVVIAYLYSKQELGQFNLASRVLEIPINLIAYTFSVVYFQHSAAIAPEGRIILFWKSIKHLGLVFIPAFVTLSLLGPWVFGIVFGSQWELAGVIAQWLSPFTALKLLFMSQSSLLLVQRKLTVDLLISSLLFVTQLGGILIGYYFFDSLIVSIATMSFLGALVYLIGLAFVRRSILS